MGRLHLSRGTFKHRYSPRLSQPSVRRILGGGPTLLKHYDPHRPKSIAEATALSLHELSGAGALHALGYHLEFGVVGVRHLARSFLYDLRPVILSQPRCQPPLNPLAFGDTESRGHRSPPIGNAPEIGRAHV